MHLQKYCTCPQVRCLPTTLLLTKMSGPYLLYVYDTCNPPNTSDIFISLDYAEYCSDEPQCWVWIGTVLALSNHLIYVMVKQNSRSIRGEHDIQAVLAMVKFRWPDKFEGPSSLVIAAHKVLDQLTECITLDYVKKATSRLYPSSGE